MIGRLLGHPRALWARREMLANLVSRELKARYKGSLLGLCWAILTPLFMALVYVFFLRLLARGIPLETVLIGVFAWQFTANCVQSGLTAVTGNANLVKKVFFPRQVLPLAGTLANTVNFLLSLGVQTVLLAFLLGARGEAIPPRAALALVVLVYHGLFNYGLSLWLAAANVYFRDVQHLVGVLLTAWFFASPAMYDLSMVAQVTAGRPGLYDLYLCNPMALIITAYRALFLPDAVFPWGWNLLPAALLPLLLLLGGGLLFQRAQRNFADYL
ncbi:MAG: ABC transporter permease [Candidatus Marinimicrobia bacterium]|nr:ABC transporter permease [Candidatus Neomarinimicrobiota bacterium]